MTRKVALITLLLLITIAFFQLDLHRLLTFDGIRAEIDQLQAWRAQAPFAVGAGFFLLYVAVTAVSLPGAAIMTLAAGLLFGFLWGTLIVSFASSIGALLAFLVARYLFGRAVQQRFSTRLAAINQGIERDGAFYLFALRLVPIFPFVLINLLMGLTPIRAATYYWVSQFGMLAGTLVYVNAGTRLAVLDSPADILSPGLLLSFALLGLFPLIASRLLGLIRRQRAWHGWRKPRRFDRNLVVIGAGAGGLVSAYIAAATGAKVTLIEARAMGGDCLNTGCVPSKALIHCARVAHAVRGAHAHGVVAGEPQIDFAAVMRQVRAAVAAVEPHDSSARYRELGVEVIEGYARLVDPWTVEIEGGEGDSKRITSRAIILATGAKPFVPPLPGLNDTGYLTSDTLWDALAAREHPPRRLVVLGGGPIGCELAQAMARLGSKVTLIEMSAHLLGREDAEAAALAAASLTADGVRLLTGHVALHCSRRNGVKSIMVEHLGHESEIEFDMLLCAVGRTARLTGYGLEQLGIDVHNHTIDTNEYLETLYPNIYAVGDVAGPWQFTHAAAHQAWHASVNALFGQLHRFNVDERLMPRTTFIDPEIASIGFTETEAAERGIACEVTRFELAELDRAITEQARRGFVKVLTEPGRDRILGVTIVGRHAGEMLAEFALAMRHGLGLNAILTTIHTYPGWSEANKLTAGAWKRAHTSPKLTTLLKRYHAWRRG